MNTETAKNGFKTFILTLSISLIVFSLVYYAVTSTSDMEDFDNEFVSRSEETAYVSAIEEDSPSVFGEIADKSDSYDGGNNKVLGTSAVLAGTDTTTDTTTTATTTTTTATTTDEVSETTTGEDIETGVLSITVGLGISLIMFLIAMFIVYKNPRNLALSGFEKSFLRD